MLNLIENITFTTSNLVYTTLVLIILTVVLIILTIFLIHYSSKALRVISHTDKLMKIQIGASITRVIKVEKAWFNQVENLINDLNCDAGNWTIDEVGTDELKISYYLHAESDLEKILLKYKKEEYEKKIKSSVTFYREL